MWETWSTLSKWKRHFGEAFLAISKVPGAEAQLLLAPQLLGWMFNGRVPSASGTTWSRWVALIMGLKPWWPRNPGSNHGLSRRQKCGASAGEVTHAAEVPLSDKLTEKLGKEGGSGGRLELWNLSSQLTTMTAFLEMAEQLPDNGKYWMNSLFCFARACSFCFIYETFSQPMSFCSFTLPTLSPSHHQGASSSVVLSCLRLTHNRFLYPEK